MRNAIRFCAALAQLLAATFIIVLALRQSITNAIPIRDHIDSDDGTMLSATCDRHDRYRLKGDLWPGEYHWEVKR